MTQCGRYSSVGIATRYELDVLAIDLRWERDFPEHSSLTPRPASLLYKGYRICYPDIKRTDTPLTTHRIIVPRLSADRTKATATDLQCS